MTRTTGLFRTYSRRSVTGFDTKSDTVELGIRVDKNVEITMDDMRPYGISVSRPSPPTSEVESLGIHGQKSPVAPQTKSMTVTWEAQ